MSGPRPTVEEQQRMAAELGADSLFYLPIEAVAQSIGLPDGSLCRACLTASTRRRRASGCTRSRSAIGPTAVTDGRTTLNELRRAR